VHGTARAARLVTAPLWKLQRALNSKRRKRNAEEGGADEQQDGDDEFAEEEEQQPAAKQQNAAVSGPLGGTACSHRCVLAGAALELLEPPEVAPVGSVGG
jgi:hypothetical protein